jgi:hypothetical protein
VLFFFWQCTTAITRICCTYIVDPFAVITYIHTYPLTCTLLINTNIYFVLQCIMKWSILFDILRVNISTKCFNQQFEYIQWMVLILKNFLKHLKYLITRGGKRVHIRTACEFSHINCSIISNRHCDS